MLVAISFRQQKPSRLRIHTVVGAQFGFIKLSNGAYRIVTKATNGQKGVSVNGRYITDGANIHQYAYDNRYTNDHWFLERIVGNYKPGTFTTPISSAAQTDINNCNNTFNSISYNILYESYYTAAFSAATAAQSAYPDAAKLLKYFLTPPFTSLQTYTIAFARMNLENSKANQNMVAEMNEAMRATEIYSSIAVTAFSSYKEKSPLTTLSNGNKLENWFLAIGGYRTWSNCNFSKSGNNYTMTMQYNMRDLYDWKAGSDELGIAQEKMDTLHKAGMARAFLVQGSMTLRLTWSTGQTIGGGANWSIVA